MANDKAKIEVSVRRLVETVHRHGGLAAPLYSGSDNVEGMRVQHKYAEKLICEAPYGDMVQEEYSVSDTLELAKSEVLIRGRADIISISPDLIQIFEIKSFRGTPDYIPSEGEFVHWAQLKIYAALILREERFREQSPPICLNLVYLAIDSDAAVEMKSWPATDELRAFLNDTVELYFSRISNLIQWKKNRALAASTARFPYDLVRSGQKDMMRSVLHCIRSRSALLVQAPTGIGKTMAALFPAVKALAANLCDRVFYATAMTSTRVAAENAARELRESGFLLRSLVLQAKEKLCPVPDIYCEQQLCPYAQNYYERLPDALEHLMLVEELTPDLILEQAKTYTLCPFELSLDISLYCDLIIGDYNHVFDPWAHIRRLFDDETGCTAVLLDEAHNLPSRAREMFSAGLKRSSFSKLEALLNKKEYHLGTTYPQLLKFTQVLGGLLDQASQLFSTTNENELSTEAIANNGITTESEAQNFLCTSDFVGLRAKPDRFLSVLARQLFFYRQMLDEQRDHELRSELLSLYFDSLRFIKIAESYFSTSSITALRKLDNETGIYLLCMDSSQYLSACYEDHFPIVFFSATLSPMEYYLALLGTDQPKIPLERLSLPSPFPLENRLLLAASQYSLRYEDRKLSMPAIISLILKCAEQKVGNYLVFCPSFAYLTQVRSYMKAGLRPDNCDVILQVPQMSEKQKAYFLSKFEVYGQKSLIGFAVLGSFFNEGIDLAGERLSGVVIIGAGLPPPSPEREIMSQYFGERFGSGFRYAYQFPGFNRIQQAAGRLIRSENDRGFILLVDSRWDNEMYRSILPEDWDLTIFDSDEDVVEAIAQFWEM